MLAAVRGHPAPSVRVIVVYHDQNDELLRLSPDGETLGIASHG